MIRCGQITKVFRQFACVRRTPDFDEISLVVNFAKRIFSACQKCGDVVALVALLDGRSHNPDALAYES